MRSVHQTASTCKHIDQVQIYFFQNISQLETVKGIYKILFQSHCRNTHILQSVSGAGASVPFSTNVNMYLVYQIPTFAVQPRFVCILVSALRNVADAFNMLHAAGQASAAVPPDHMGD